MQTLGVPGAFGGGREGVQQAEYQTGSDRNRADASSRIITTRLWSTHRMGAQQAFQNQQAMQQANARIRSSGIRIRHSNKWVLSQFQRAGTRCKMLELIGQLGSYETRHKNKQD